MVRDMLCLRFNNFAVSQARAFNVETFSHRASTASHHYSARSHGMHLSATSSLLTIITPVSSPLEKEGDEEEVCLVHTFGHVTTLGSKCEIYTLFRLFREGHFSAPKVT